MRDLGYPHPLQVHSMDSDQHSWRPTRRHNTTATRGQHQHERKEVSLGCPGSLVLTGALLDRAMAGQVMHDAVVSLRVRPRGRGHQALKR